MKRLLFAGVALAFVTSAFAQTTTTTTTEYFVVHDQATKKCIVTDKRPTTTTSVVVGAGGFKTKVEAEAGMKKEKVCVTN